jgi:hypothetical protein
MSMGARRILVLGAALAAVGLATVVIRKRVESAQREVDTAMIRRIHMQLYPDGGVTDCGRPNSD